MTGLRYTEQMIIASQEGTVPEGICETNCVHPEAVAEARAALPDRRDVETASAFLKLVADPTRLRLLSALNTRELCVCDLAAVVGLSERRGGWRITACWITTSPR
ncbi:hypothetical protein DESA109040_00395 [Deinococcus saxicola]